MTTYYATEEKAMAPGISGEWPRVIPKPDNPHGRLVKVEGYEARLISAAADLLEVLREIQWSGTTDCEDGGFENACPYCDVPESDGEHASDCKLAAAIVKAMPEHWVPTQ